MKHRKFYKTPLSRGFYGKVAIPKGWLMNSIFIHDLARFDSDRPFLNERKNDSFASFLEAGLDNDVEVCVSNADNFNKRNKRIKKAWIYDDKWKKVRSKKAELCYYHGKTMNIYNELTTLKQKLNIPIVNHTSIETICDDKLLTHEMFPALVPPTFPLQSIHEFYKAMKMIGSDKVVLKPRFGSRGMGVFVYDKQNILDVLPRNVLAQQFIDSSNGILGIKSVHDLRVTIVNGRLDHAYLRLPERNSLICNAAQGGSKVFLDLDDLPSEIISTAKMIDNTLKIYGTRVYTVDFMKDNNGRFWVIELNSKPGTAYYDGKERIRYRFYSNVIKAVKKMLK